MTNHYYGTNSDFYKLNGSREQDPGDPVIDIQHYYDNNMHSNHGNGTQSNIYF